MTKKVFISVLLLLTYSLGFAHNIIPHQHDTETPNHVLTHEKHGHHHHHHHNGLSKKLHTDHEHVQHGNHYDEDLYDLLICFLHKTDHQENDCKDQHFLPAKLNRVTINKLQANKLVAVLFSLVSDIQQNELITDCHINSNVSYLSLLIEDTPLRGPPVLS